MCGYSCFTGGSGAGGGWECRLPQVPSPNLPRTRPLALLTGLCGFSKAWVAFFLHHLLAWKWLLVSDLEIGPNTLPSTALGCEEVEMIINDKTCHIGKGLFLFLRVCVCVCVMLAGEGS